MSRNETELQKGQKQITELEIPAYEKRKSEGEKLVTEADHRYIEMLTYEERKSEGEKLVTESVADFEKGSIDHVLFESNMNKALTLYNQAIALVPANSKRA